MSTEHDPALIEKAAKAVVRVERRRALLADVDLPSQYARAVLDAVAEHVIAKRHSEPGPNDAALPIDDPDPVHLGHRCEGGGA